MGESGGEIENAGEEEVLGDEEDTQVLDQEDEEEVPPTRYNVSTYGWDSDVEGLVKRLDRGDIFVPGFQRGLVWSTPEKSRFIESLILGLPVPNIFLAQDPDTKSLNIIDGQQRLKSLQGFLNGGFRLSGSSIQDELKGNYYSSDVAPNKKSKTLSDADQRSLADAVLHSIVIRPDAAHDDVEKGREYNTAIIEIFHRLNTSGKRLSSQEIRASIFYGPLDDLLRKLNQDEQWRELFGPVHSRLKDVELILRFLALKQDHESYRGPMPKFLDNFMERNRNISAERASELGQAFANTVRMVNSSIGRDGLRSGSTLTVARFDALMAGFDSYAASGAELDEGEIVEKLAELEADEEYKWSIEEFVNDTERVKTRIKRARAIFGA
jgi:hypothetical protein